MRAVFIWLTLCSAALADGCPSDRPIELAVVDYSKPIQCTAVACLGELSCPGDDLTPCMLVPSNSCNTCTGPATIKQCFSQDEIDAAHKVRPVAR